MVNLVFCIIAVHEVEPEVCFDDARAVVHSRSVNDPRVVKIDFTWIWL